MVIFEGATSPTHDLLRDASLMIKDPSTHLNEWCRTNGSCTDRNKRPGIPTESLTSRIIYSADVIEVSPFARGHGTVCALQRSSNSSDRIPIYLQHNGRSRNK